MPHFVIDCSENVIELVSPDEIMQQVYDAALSTGLFAQGDIKVRVNPFKYYTTGNSKDNFIHVFANIMEGRDNDQKSKLSKKIITVLTGMLPSVPVISINIRDFEKASYCNKSII